MIDLPLSVTELEALSLASVARALKPTIIDGKWVYAPPPPQDIEWLKRHPQPIPPIGGTTARICK